MLDVDVLVRKHDRGVSVLIAWGFDIVDLDVLGLLVLINGKVKV